MASDESGVPFLAFTLYDAEGQLIASSNGFERFPDGLTVHSEAGELVLHVPADSSAPVQYRLYSPNGHLLTCSDGLRTRVYGELRMEGVARGWTLAEA